MNKQNVLPAFDKLLTHATTMKPHKFWRHLQALLKYPSADLGCKEAKEAATNQIRIMLSRLVELNQNRIDELLCPKEVKHLVDCEFQRIRACISNGNSNYFNLADDKLRADFRVACLARIPVGVEHIEIGGLSRSLLVRGGIRQALQFLHIMWSTGARPPYYESHLSHTLIPFRFSLDYNYEARIATYRNIAACLEMNPRYRGLICGSWWFDPQVRKISPHLPDFAKIMLDNGAFLFRYGKSPSALRNALYYSPARQRLYQEKKYSPREYIVVWPRGSLITWAKGI
jgi:hypothetical protein